MDEIIEKIQKLLSLASSDNEHEAKLAAQKAQELLTKYNLSTSQINASSDYERLAANDKMELNYNIRHKYITNILTLFFFVRVIMVPVREENPNDKHFGRTKKQFQLVGRKVNTTIAKQIFLYLDRVYIELWKAHRKKYEVDGRKKRSYYYGLTASIMKKLMDHKWRLEEESGLVVVGDKGLDDYVNELTNGVKHKDRDFKLDRTHAMAGAIDGESVRIQKTIETKNETSQTIMIGGPINNR